MGEYILGPNFASINKKAIKVYSQNCGYWWWWWWGWGRPQVHSSRINILPLIYIMGELIMYGNGKTTFVF